MLEEACYWGRVESLQPGFPSSSYSLLLGIDQDMAS